MKTNDDKSIQELKNEISKTTIEIEELKIKKNKNRKIIHLKEIRNGLLEDLNKIQIEL